MCTVSISSRKTINISVSVDTEFLEGDGLNGKGGWPSFSFDGELQLWFPWQNQVTLCFSQPAASLAWCSSSFPYICTPAPMRYTTQTGTGQSKTQFNDIQGNIPVIPIICHSHVNSLGGGCFLTMRICSLVSGNYHLSSMWVIITGHGSISSPKMKCQNCCDKVYPVRDREQRAVNLRNSNRQHWVASFPGVCIKERGENLTLIKKWQR